MKSKNVLTLICTLIILCMLAVTTWASLYEGVITGGQKILAEPWGLATMFDTYFAFLTFYFWVFYKEARWIPRLVWLILILSLGNIVMSGYILWQLYKLPKNAATWQILQKNA